jgi:hypothetical protein
VLDLPDWFDQRERANAYQWRMSQAPVWKFHSCPNGHEDAIVITDIDENKAKRDEDGNLQYYCRVCGVTFSVDADGHIILK